MTCKTHTILYALQSLRDEGFSGKINPEMIRELTGIEKTGNVLCTLRSKGYLIDAGFIYLPAARGKTKANQYIINPESDLIPRERNVATIQKNKRERGMMPNSKTSDIRKAIKSYNGDIWSTSQIRKDIGMYPQTFQRLEYLESLGEIKRMGLIKTGGRSSMTWQEVKINESLIYKEPVVEEVRSNNPWANVWPEFFRIPNLQGTVRVYCESI